MVLTLPMRRLAILCAVMVPLAFTGIIEWLLVGKSISSEQFKHLIGVLVILSLVMIVWQGLAIF